MSVAQRQRKNNSQYQPDEKRDGGHGLSPIVLPALACYMARTNRVYDGPPARKKRNRCPFDAGFDLRKFYDDFFCFRPAAGLQCRLLIPKSHLNGGRAMMTSYLVTCPHPDCRWFGSLLPRDSVDSWSGPKPGRGIVTFHCPECDNEWQARVVGDDVV